MATPLQHALARDAWASFQSLPSPADEPRACHPPHPFRNATVDMRSLSAVTGVEDLRATSCCFVFLTPSTLGLGLGLGLGLDVIFHHDIDASEGTSSSLLRRSTQLGKIDPAACPAQREDWLHVGFTMVAL